MKKRKFPKSEIIRERWLRGMLSYKLHDGQKKLSEKFRASTRQLFVGECSRQFGKSFDMVVEALQLAYRKPKARIKYGTAFHTDLLEFIMPTFDAVLEDCPEDARPVFKSVGSKYIIPHNKSEIKLVGLDKNPNGLRGNVIDLIVLDEAGFISNLDYLYKSVIIPATTHRPDCRIVFISTPPSTPAHAFLDYVEKAEFEGSHALMTIYDNPMVNQETIDRLMEESGGPDSTTWKREYLCQHIVDQDLAIVPEWKESFVQELPRDAYYPFYHKYIGMDLGVSDFTAVIFGYYDFLKATLVIEDEYVVRGPTLTTKILSDAIQAKEKELVWEKEAFKKISDNNNPLLLQDLSYLHDIHFSPTDKGRLEEMINALRMLVKKGKIIVHPRCKHLKGCLKYGVWDKHRKNFSQSKVYGHFDALAALVYLVRNLDTQTNPIPADFQVDFSNQLLLPNQREQQSIRDLKRAFRL